jgi:BolA protein
MRPSLDELRARFAAAFPGDSVELADDSHLHAGHAGSAGGAGHFTVRIVSGRFDGVPTVGRHRLVYDAVRDWMPHRVHALVVVARSPSEATPT